VQENPLLNKEDINRYQCENCGGNMIFDPKVGKLRCPHCDSTREIPKSGAPIEERDFYNFLRPENQRLQKMATDAMQVSCSSCGATVVFIPPTTASACDFCGVKIVAQPKVADPLLAPESVLPFSVTSKDALAALNSWTSSRWFAPSALKTMAQADKADSVYLPFWTFDSDTSTDYTGKRGDDYQVTETYLENGEERTRTRTETNWSYASGNVYRHFNDVSVPATTSVLPKYIGELNWDFNELVPYEPAYLSGHLAQTYQVSLEEGFEHFKLMIEDAINSDVRRDIGGDRQQINSLDTQYSNITFKHLLVPVYAGAYRFNNKVYQIIVNGKTGEVYGERPYSWLKIACLVIAILLLLFVIVSIAGLKR
jgi:DNA-directed RNA polymerase subunit RPC12/RpoP